MTTTITFTEHGWTEVITHQTNVPAKLADPRAREGFETSLRRFEQYLATLAARADI